MQSLRDDGVTLSAHLTEFVSSRLVDCDLNFAYALELSLRWKLIILIASNLKINNNGPCA